jgi:hypothetical protein
MRTACAAKQSVHTVQLTSLAAAAAATTAAAAVHCAAVTGA